VANVRLDDDAAIDVDVDVRVALNIGDDQVRFFEDLFGAYGADWADSADAIVSQLIADAIRSSPGAHPDLERNTLGFRVAAGRSMGPRDVFRVVDVLRLEVPAWDAHQQALREAEQRAVVTRIEEIRRVETEAIAGDVRARSCLALGRLLGVDPVSLWDPEGHRSELASQRDAIVRLLGEYGANLAMLADALEVDEASLGDLLARISGRPVYGASSLGHAARPAPVAASGSQMGVLHMDGEIRLLRETTDDAIVGGVLRRLALVGGDAAQLAIVAHDKDAAPPVDLGKYLPEGTSLVVAPYGGDALQLFQDLVHQVVGVNVDDADLQMKSGRYIWKVPDQLRQGGDIGQFMAESICDVFKTPSIVPV
jgi:hypothetical protein